MLLMHKDIPVADVIMQNGSIVDVREIFNREHYPTGAYSEHEQLRGPLLDNWQKTRAIPRERQNAGKIMAKIGCGLEEAVIKSKGVSLTDCYWYKTDSQLTWHDVNYHSNGFSQNYAYNMIFGTSDPIDFKSPDFTTDGLLEKYWISLEGVPTLLKHGKFGYKAQGKHLLCANEVVASKLAEAMGIPHVSYFPIKVNGEVICGCSCFIKTENEEFVTALQIQKENLVFDGPELLKLLRKKGLGSFLDGLIVFTALIGNTDCHTKNFGVIRDSNALDILSPAPLFDCGSSLGWNGQYNIEQIVFKPFAENISDHLALAETISDKLPSPQEAQQVIDSVYRQFDISDEHCEMAKKAIENNINRISYERHRTEIFLDENDTR